MNQKKPKYTETYHIKELDGVRACSILLVIAAHTLPLGPKYLELNASAGIMGMSLFFCLSGFLITRFLDRRQPIFHFIIKRTARIFLSSALYLTVFLIIFELPIESYYLNLLFVLNYLIQVLGGGPVGYLCSLFLEMYYYIAFAFLVLTFGRRSLWVSFLYCLIITGYEIYKNEYATINTHNRADELLIGGCVALLYSIKKTQKLIKNILSSSVFCLPLLLVSILSPFASSQKFGGLIHHFAFYFMGLTIISIIFRNISFLRLFICNSIMSYIAKISYALYIWHPLMVSGFMNEGNTYERYLFKRPISFSLTWLAAHLSTFWWQKWWTDKARTFLAARSRMIATNQ